MTHDRPHGGHAALTLSIVLLFATPSLVLADTASAPRMPDASRAAPSPRLAVPSPEWENASSSLISPFVSGRAVVPNAQTLSPPVTVNANTSADALTVTQTGTGRAISGVINNAKSTISALKGTTNGSGAALAGQNTGTTGSAGQFQITNASSGQAGLVSSTTGTGNAIQAIQGSAGNSDAPAILGQHLNGSQYYGVGVEGDGNAIGVNGLGFGSASVGVHGSSPDGFGVYGESSDGYGVYGYAPAGPAVYGNSSGGVGVYGYSLNNYGVVGWSANSYSGYFYGQVYVTGTLTAKTFATTSDRNVKQAITPVDTGSVLDQVAAMPISSWDFQAEPGIHHIGPMAQDFRAAFGLGADDKHIDLVDGVGVSLAAIQELQRQIKAKDAASVDQQSRISEQQARINALEARLVALEQRPVGATALSAQP